MLPIHLSPILWIVPSFLILYPFAVLSNLIWSCHFSIRARYSCGLVFFESNSLYLESQNKMVTRKIGRFDENNESNQINHSITPVLYMSCLVYDQWCIWPVLCATSLVYDRSGIWPVWYMTSDAYDQSCIWPVLYMTCSVYDNRCIWPVLCMTSLVSVMAGLVYDLSGI